VKTVDILIQYVNLDSERELKFS